MKSQPVPPPPGSSKTPASPTRLVIAEPLRSPWLLPHWPDVLRFLRRNWLGITVLLGLCILLLLPYEFRPGGQVQILPLTQQAIQAPITGQITQVMVKGGDGQVITAGTPIAILETPEVETDLLQIQDQIQGQQAILQQAEAYLNQLLTTPRQVTVTVAQKQVETAKQDVIVAQEQVVAAQERVDFSSTSATRYQELLRDGVVSIQQADAQQQQADVDLANLDTQKAYLERSQKQLQEAEANLKLVLSGPHPQEIQAARDVVMAAQAELQRLQKQQSYLADQIRKTTLTMPFDGRLITSGLQEKLGLYLNKGDTFAQAEAGDNRTLLARVRIPEVAFDQLTPQGEVEVKLLAFPNQPRTGLIRSVQPAIAPAESAERTLETSGDRSVEVQLNSGRFVDVLVELPNQDGVLKPGMTGHAKIEGSTMPVFAAFSRSIVRFIMVEIWSWLP